MSLIEHRTMDGGGLKIKIKFADFIDLKEFFSVELFSSELRIDFFRRIESSSDWHGKVYKGAEVALRVHYHSSGVEN